MNNKTEKRLLELLSDKALFGLNEEEMAELENLGKEHPELVNDESFELAAAAFQVASIDQPDEMPDFLNNRIADQADDIWRETFGVDNKDAADGIDNNEPNSAFVQWLGWVVAGVACIALIANLWIGGIGEPPQVAGGDGNPVTEVLLPTVSERRTDLLASASKLKLEWASPQKDLKVEGDVVWSDEKQEGYMRFRGLPVNDKSKETYQLWIFDESQDEKTPIDGGVFDINEDGEAIVAIDANLKVRGPKAFAVTVEKPGGVMVSDRKRIVALAAAG